MGGLATSAASGAALSRSATAAPPPPFFFYGQPSVARPPREGLGATASPVVVVNVSFFGLTRVRSFFCFETSPHCGNCTFKANRVSWVTERGRGRGDIRGRRRKRSIRTHRWPGGKGRGNPCRRKGGDSACEARAREGEDNTKQPKNLPSAMRVTATLSSPSVSCRAYRMSTSDQSGNISLMRKSCYRIVSSVGRPRLRRRG